MISAVVWARGSVQAQNILPLEEGADDVAAASVLQPKGPSIELPPLAADKASLQTKVAPPFAAGGEAKSPASSAAARKADPIPVDVAEIPDAAIPDALPATTAAEPGELLVKFAAGLDAAAKAELLAAIGGRVAEVLRDGGAEGALTRVTLAPGLSEEQAIEILAGLPGVAFAERNTDLKVEFANDPGFTGGLMWGAYGNLTTPRNDFGSQAAEAWAAGHVGSTKVVIGVIDSGINYTHPDLYLNVWLNQGEIPISFRHLLTDVDGDGLITFRDLNHEANAAFVTDLNGNGFIDAGDLLRDKRWANGTDQDGNGFVDDLIGWNFVNNTNDPWDDNGHGTHVSGIIGAMGNNGIGVAGIAWDVQIMPLKFLSATGAGSTANAVRALDYYTAAGKASEGANFVATNNSWGGGSYSLAMQGAIDRTAQGGSLFVAAAGNNGRDTDVTPFYPASYSTLQSAGFEAVISVAAITSTGGLASFSNWGAASVDLGAPGASIYSTTSNGGYGYMSGTSMAAPHVTGAIALYAAKYADATAEEIRSALLASTTQTASLEGRTVTGGRLDAEAMLGIAPPREPSRTEPEVVPEPEPEPLPEPEPEPVPEPVPAVTFFFGTAGADTIIGTDGQDVISGIPAEGNMLGRGTIDVLIGGAGADIFVLGDERGFFYDWGSGGKNSGRGDYARIMDFELGVDKLQLSASATHFFRRIANLDGFDGLAVFVDTNGNGTLEPNRDEVIAHLVGIRTISEADLIFV